MTSQRMFACAIALMSAACHAQVTDWAFSTDAMALQAQGPTDVHLAAAADGSTLFLADGFWGSLPDGWSTGNRWASPNVRAIDGADASYRVVAGGMFPAPGGGGFAAFGQPSNSFPGMMVMRFAANGETLWSRQLGGARQATTEFSLSPDGSVLAVHLAEAAVVHALDAASGAVHWSNYRDGEYGTDGGNSIPQIVAMNDRSVWIQRGPYSGLMRLKGAERRVFSGPSQARAELEGKSCGLIALPNGWLQISTSLEANLLLIAKHDLNGNLLSTVTASLPPTSSFKQRCESFRLGDHVAIQASDLFAVDVATGNILWRRAMPYLTDIERFNSSWIGLGAAGSAAGLYQIEPTTGSMTTLTAPHGAVESAGETGDLALRPDGLIATTLVSPATGGQRTAVFSRYNLDLTLDPQPIDRLTARRGALIGSTLSTDRFAQYLAWIDWHDGANTLIVQKRSPQTGAVVWHQRHELGPQHLAQRAFSLAPTLSLSTSRLFITANGRVDDNSTDAAFIIAVDTSNGAMTARREWGPSAAAPQGSLVTSISVDAFDLPYLRLWNTGGSRNVIALTSDLQNTRWEIPNADAASVVVVGDALLTAGSAIAARALNTGQQRWMASIAAAWITPLPNNQVAIASFRQTEPRATRVTVFDMSTGAVVSEGETATAQTENVRVTGLVRDDNDNLFLGGYRFPRNIPNTGIESPFVTRFNATTGAASWKYEPPLGEQLIRVSSLIAGPNQEIWARLSETVFPSVWLGNIGQILRLRGGDGGIVGRQVVTTASPPLANDVSASSLFLGRTDSGLWMTDAFRPGLGNRRTRIRGLSIPTFRPSQVNLSLAPDTLAAVQNAEINVVVTVSNSAPSAFSGTLTVTPPWWGTLLQADTLSVPLTLSPGEQQQRNFVLFVRGPLNCFNPNEASPGTFTATIIPSFQDSLPSAALPSASATLLGRSDRLFSSSLEPDALNGC